MAKKARSYELILIRKLRVGVKMREKLTGKDLRSIAIEKITLIHPDYLCRHKSEMIAF